MKIFHLSLVLFLFCLFTAMNVNAAKAQFNAINSGYAVTTNKHGQPVLIGESVTAWAGTTNQSVYMVEFVWKNETDYTIFAENVTNFVNYTTPNCPLDAPQEIINWAVNHENITIWYFNNTQIPNQLGNWTVQVFFYANGGHLCGQGSDIIKIRATSFHAIPDAPTVGTAGIITAMLFGLGLFKCKRNKVLKN
ncbi:MAG: hypothetical protein ACUVTE_01595 [Candidatus Bathycorpusculaceae bacterium]